MSSTDPAQPEYVGSDGPAPLPADGGGSRGGARHGLLVAAVVAVVVVVGAGAWAAGQFFAGGSSPASAVPASAIGYVSLDLDPSASQKIEAIKIIRKFPGLRKEIKIGSGDDVRRRILEEITKESGCTSLDYDDDVLPWIGERVAIAVVPGSNDRVIPLVALQVGDEHAARAGLRALESCDKGGDALAFAFAFSGDYALITEKQADADAMATSADSSALQDDSDFSTWMARAGDSGIITIYAAPNAVDVVVKAQKAAEGDSLGTTRSPTDSYAKAFEGFDGAVGVVRFADGAVEADFSTKGLKSADATGGSGADVQSLPGTTAAVVSLALKDGWLDGQVDRIKSLVGAEQYDEFIAQGEQQTGLSLPDDIETLLGDGLTVSLDSSADLSSLTRSPDPASVPAGVRIKGDAAEITRILDQLKKVAGPQGDVVKVSSSGDTVSVGTDPAYVERLLEKGDLGSRASFRDAVPEADRASGVFYLDFDAGGGFATEVGDLVSDKDPEVKANLEPLHAFGASGWVDGSGVQHSLVRLTTN